MSTGIHWTNETWNPTTGCSRVSPGCEHCYAESLSLRYGWSKLPWTAANAGENVKLHPDRLSKPLGWKKPRLIFVDSMSDLFHEWVPDEFIGSVFAVMAAAHWHTFQVLTKRPERMRAILSDEGWWDRTLEATHPMGSLPRNIWLGVSVEDQRRANERIPVLLETPAAVRFLSCEPLLGPLDLTWAMTRPHWSPDTPPRLVDWVIVGGESGPGHRPMEPWWAQSIRDQCQMLAIPFFYKQGSGPRPGMNRELDGRMYEEMPVLQEAKAVLGL